MRALLKTLLAVAILYAAILGAALAVMYQPPKRFGDIMAHVPDIAFAVVPFRPLWFIARGGRLQPGDAAPAFELPTPDKAQTVQLASFRGARPVVLVFGSYT